MAERADAFWMEGGNVVEQVLGLGFGPGVWTLEGSGLSVRKVPCSLSYFCCNYTRPTRARAFGLRALTWFRSSSSLGGSCLRRRRLHFKILSSQVVASSRLLDGLAASSRLFTACFEELQVSRGTEDSTSWWEVNDSMGWAGDC